MKCLCQDSAGEECGNEMTYRELTQDGMCDFCADNVWGEMRMVEGQHYTWYHPKEKDK